MCTPPNTLPRVLYAIDLDPTLKFGSLEEQIVCMVKAFEVNGGLFHPLFICGERSTENTPFQEFGIETDCLDLRSFRWSELIRLSRIIARRQITLVHWNFTDMLRNSYLWWLTLLHPSVR